MWNVSELLLILVLLTAAESVINAAPHPGRRSLMGFFLRLLGYSGGILVMTFSETASFATQVIFLLLAAYMFRWFVQSAVAYIRGPRLFEQPRKADIAALAADLTGLPERQCSRVASAILRQHDVRVALLGLILLAEKASEVQDLEKEWLEYCAVGREEVLELMEISGADGVANALFFAEILCMYEINSVKNALSAQNRPHFRGRSGRIWITQRLEKSGRVRRRAEEYGLPVEQKSTGRHKGAPVPFIMKIWPPKGLAGAGHPVRGRVLLVSIIGMLAYGVFALSIDRSSGWIFIIVGVLVYILALLAVPDFRELAARHKDVADSKGGET